MMSKTNRFFRILLSPFVGLFKFFGGYGNRLGQVRFFVLIIFLATFALAFFNYPLSWNRAADVINAKKNNIERLKQLPNLPQFTARFPFRLGLDLLGGTHLVYEADVSGISEESISSSMDGVRDVIELRVNKFGIAEPIVQVSKVGNHYRLIVELAGISDVNQAIKEIGETPLLQFKVEQTDLSVRDEILKKSLEEENFKAVKDLICADSPALSTFILATNEDPCFVPTELTGKYLDSAEVAFDPNTNQPIVSLVFDGEGAQIFENLTAANINKPIAIFLDGIPISIPRVEQKIAGGRAQITGTFTIQEVKELTRRLNAGALPVPITLVNQQTIGATLGRDSLQKSLVAGLWGLMLVAVFMIIYYRLPGLLSVFALAIYTTIALAMFKLLSVTLTLAGIAGFILSVGMAVDANILVFERMKEEFRSGRTFSGAVDEGFWRAWLSIRDSNVSSLLTCVILFWLGTSVVKGFALTLGIGILVSMFSAIIVTRNLLRLFSGTRAEKWTFLFNSKNNA